MAASDRLSVEHSVGFAGTIAQAWRSLHDLEIVATCLPGGSLQAAGDDVAEGKVKVRFGQHHPTLRGTARVAERNARAHRVRFEVSAADARGTTQLDAAVTVAVRRAGDTTIIRFDADIDLRGRPTELPRAVRETACRQVFENFADSFTSPINEGDVVADHAAEDREPDADSDENAAARIEGSAPQPVDDPDAVEPAPDVVPPGGEDDDAAQESVLDASEDLDSSAAAAPAFGTPGGIPVPTLDDEPSVNGHGAANGYGPPAESDLARHTRQAMAKRIAPVAVGLVFVLAAARRRRGRRA